MAKKKSDIIEKEVEKKDTYEHFIRAVPVDENFEKTWKLNYILIHSYEELMDFYNNKFVPNSFFAWDTETTSLNPEQGEKTGDMIEGRIVGYSFTQNGHDGYYVPLTHPDIAIGYKGLKVLYAMACRSKLNLLYNCRFDMRFLEFMTPEKYGYIPEPDEKIYPFDLSKIKYLDVQNPVWLSDTNVPMPSLKKSEKHFLGWLPPTFNETTGGETNFGYIPAEQGYRYGCIDALATYNLFFKTERFYAESGAAAKLDNDAFYPLMKLENTPIYVDHDYLKSMRTDILKHLEELKQYLYVNAGTEYNINSGRELASVFQQLGIDTGKRTKTGIMETNIKAIENYLVSHGNNEYLKKLVEYKQLIKFDNSYLEKLIKMSQPDETKKHPIRFCYFTCRVPSGRLASGTDGKNTFFSHINFQSLPKPHSHNYHVHKATPEQIEKGEDLCGYIFNDDPEGSLGLTEGQDPHLNVRKAFHAEDPDSVIISVDMCLEGGSPVQSKRGYIGVSDLKVGDEIFTPDGYVKVTRVKNTGAKVLYKIKTNGQAIYCSEDHPFMINNECVPANKINNVLTQEKIPTYIEYNIKKTNLFNKFKELKDINSIVEKANYIKNNNLIDDFIKAYNNYTAADTAKMCFIKNSSFRHIINYLDLNDKCNKEFCSVQKQHVFNPFKTSNPTSAYLLGYILGDGNISIRRNSYYTLNITSKDYEHINQIKNIFDDTIKLSEHTKNNHKTWSLSIVDQDVCNDLIKLGIKPRKSYVDSTINFEWLGNNLSHFIRGLFDADGCIRIKNSNSLEFTIAGHCSYINEIYNCMNNQWSCYKLKNENISILNKIWSNIDKCDFYKYLYTNATIWLQRKRDIFDEYIINNFHQLPEFEMYDITIDSNDHVYFCNGILTHNCAEELRLVANIYNEQTWAKAFNSGEDVHKITAYKIFGKENYCKEARKKAKCISGNSLLYTDSGIIPIREVNSSRIIGEPVDVDFKLATPDGFCKCSKFIYNGIKQTLKFNMNNGDTLEVTPDHLIRSNNKWICAKDLKEGDFIDFESIETFNNNYQYINLTYITNATLKFTKELAYYIGAVLGDGSISKKNVYFISEDYELIQYMSGITKMYNLGLGYENVQKYTKTSNKPFIRLNCGAKKARTLCNDIGLTDETGHKIFAVPDIVFKSPNEVKFAFIQGLFDTDGTISNYEGHKHNFCLEFCTKSKQLAIGCAHLLKSLGISCRICDSYNKVYDRTYYKLKIRATSAHQFKNLGGFRCIHKQQRLLKWCNNSFVKEYKKHYQILSIEKSESDVYDLTIENDSHSFLANGFAVHNCASFGILYGSSAYGFHNQFPDMSLEECEEFIDKFKAALPSIEAGQRNAIRFARKNGYIKTYFGRPRRVKYYLNNTDRSMRGFGERTVKNTAVQGAAGDCLKLMIVRLWKDLFTKYADKGVKWIGTIHDEINLLCPKYLLNEVAPIVLRCMTIKLPDWPVPLLPDLSIGKSFGELIPFDVVYNEDGTAKEFVPQIETVKPQESHDEHLDEISNYIPEIEEDDYNYLQ